MHTVQRRSTLGRQEHVAVLNARGSQLSRRQAHQTVGPRV